MTQSQSPRRVVVAGVGAVTAHGSDGRRPVGRRGAGRVAIGPVEHLPMDGYRTRLGGEVKEQDAAHPRLPAHPAGYRRAGDRLRLAGRRGGVRPVGVTPDIVPPERWGVVIGTCNAGLLSGQHWYAAAGTASAPIPAAAVASRRRPLPRRSAAASSSRGPALSVNTACAAGRQRDRLCGRPGTQRPGRRRADRRRRRALRRAVRRLQLARVPVPRAGGPVLEGPPGAVARRRQRDARAHAPGHRGSRSGRRCWPR